MFLFGLLCRALQNNRSSIDPCWWTVSLQEISLKVKSLIQRRVSSSIYTFHNNRIDLLFLFLHESKLHHRCLHFHDSSRSMHLKTVMQYDGVMKLDIGTNVDAAPIFPLFYSFFYGRACCDILYVFLLVLKSLRQIVADAAYVRLCFTPAYWTKPLQWRMCSTAGSQCCCCTSSLESATVIAMVWASMLISFQPMFL